MGKVFELAAFAISAAAFGYGAFTLFRREIPEFFKLYVCGAGCYMLEELWFVVNSLFGNGSEDGLVTVRLFGLFGCLCFMLSANTNAFDRIVDEGKRKLDRISALIAPAVLLALYVLFVFSPYNAAPVQMIVTGFITLAPALFAAYFSLKHLLLPPDELGLLRTVKSLDIFALIFYTANFAYPLINLYCSKLFMSMYDLAVTAMLVVIVVICRRGAVRWKALI